MTKHKLAVALLGLCQAVSAYADSDARLEHFLSLSLDELVAQKVTISTNTEQLLAKAPAVVTVITEADIRATGAANLVDILEGVPGIHVRASHFANRPLVHIRGANATQTLLMVNGAPLKDLMWGYGIFWKGLPASMIGRVEIIRGPGSALFGSDAAAGVINVITKTAGRITHAEAGVRVGSFASTTGWLQHGGNWNGFDIGVTAELSDTDGYDPYIARDGQAASGHARYGWRNQDLRVSVAKGDWRLLADYMHHSDLGVGLTGAGVLDPLTGASDHRYNVDLLYNNGRFGQDWGLNAELRLGHLDYSSGDGFQERPPGYSDGTYTYADGVINRMRSAEQRLSGEVSGLYSGAEGHAIRLGAGYVLQDLYSVEQFVNRGTGPDGMPLDGTTLVDISDTPYAFAPEKSRKIGYLFVQDIWKLAEDWELTAGARYDHYSDFGGTLNPRLALVWQSTDRLTTKLMYGHAFRAPSYQELYAVTSRSLPNPELAPERSRTWDLAFSYAAAKDLRLGISLYHFHLTDLIAPVGSPSQFQNAGDHTIRGLELEALWQVAKDLRLSGNYSLRQQDDTVYRSVYVPDREAYLRADWEFLPRWNLDLQANWLGRRARATGDSRPAVAAYTLVDGTVRHSAGKAWEFAASVRNLFDVGAREYTGPSVPDDLPLPGRSFYAEMRYKF